MNQETKSWKSEKEGLYRKFNFDTFGQASAFVEHVFKLAQEQNHHPKILNDYTQVEIWFSTHSAHGDITDIDHAMAERINNFVDLVDPDEKKTTNVQMDVDRKQPIKLYTDGGSRGNPGPSAGAYFMTELEGKEIEKEGYYLGITTNNQAEYQALRHGLERAHEIGFARVHVYMDSL